METYNFPRIEYLAYSLIMAQFGHFSRSYHLRPVPVDPATRQATAKFWRSDLLPLHVPLLHTHFIGGGGGGGATESSFLRRFVIGLNRGLKIKDEF